MLAQSAHGKISGLLIKGEGHGVLLEELMLYCDVVQSTNHHVATVLGLVVCTLDRCSTKNVDALAQLVLYQDQSLHRVVQGQVVLIHLG